MCAYVTAALMCCYCCLGVRSVEGWHRLWLLACAWQLLSGVVFPRLRCQFCGEVLVHHDHGLLALLPHPIRHRFHNQYVTAFTPNVHCFDARYVTAFTLDCPATPAAAQCVLPWTTEGGLHRLGLARRRMSQTSASAGRPLGVGGVRAKEVVCIAVSVYVMALWCTSPSSTVHEAVQLQGTDGVLQAVHIFTRCSTPNTDVRQGGTVHYALCNVSTAWSGDRGRVQHYGSLMCSRTSRTQVFMFAQVMFCTCAPCMMGDAAL
jgi:hypothetical protein